MGGAMARARTGARLPQEVSRPRRFASTGGVSIGGRAVPSAPHIRVVGCVKQPPYAVGQKTWLWDGHNVFVALLLIPGKCHVAGDLVRARVALTTVGT
jgi:hypothetical protein